MAFASATGHLAHLWKCFSTAGDFAAIVISEIRATTTTMTAPIASAW